MRRVALRAAPFLGLALGLALASCAGMRPAPSSGTAASPPPDSAANAPAAPESPAPASGEAPPPAGNDDNSPPSAANAAVPTCVPPETKAKPHYRPKPKPARHEAPPQLSTSPAVAGTAPGGVVDAQVKRMPVAVMSILGKRVKGPSGDDLGRVVDVLADASGRVRVAIIDFGGFLGVGDRRSAVDWPLLRFTTDGGDTSLLLSVNRAKLQTAPEYKDLLRPETLMEPEAPAVPAAPAAADVAATAPAGTKK